MTLIIDRYDPEHSCITLPELRWILARCRRHTPYYTYFLLRATTGMRGDEARQLTRDGRRGRVCRCRAVVRHQLSSSIFRSFASRVQRAMSSRM